MQSIIREIRLGHLDSAQVDEQLFHHHLYTRYYPDPDLLIRTSGEMRLSNFLLWQLSYTEIYVTPTFWPDFRAPASRRRHHRIWQPPTAVWRRYESLR